MKQTKKLSVRTNMRAGATKYQCTQGSDKGVITCGSSIDGYNCRNWADVGSC